MLHIRERPTQPSICRVLIETPTKAAPLHSTFSVPCTNSASQNHILTEPSLITIEAEDKQANS